MIASIHLAFIIASTSVSTLEPSEVCSVHYNSSGCSQISITNLCSIKRASWVATFAKITPTLNHVFNKTESQFDLIAMYNSTTPGCLRFVITYVKGPSSMEFSLVGDCAKTSSLAIKLRYEFQHESIPARPSTCAEIFVTQIKPKASWLPFRETIDFEFVVNNYMVVSTEYGQMLLVVENPVPVGSVDLIEARLGIRFTQFRSAGGVLPLNCNCDSIEYYCQWVANNSRERGEESVFDYDYAEVMSGAIVNRTTGKEKNSRNSGMLLIVVVTGGALFMIVGVTIHILKDFEKQQNLDE